jgi:hypothetical protein
MPASAVRSWPNVKCSRHIADIWLKGMATLFVVLRTVPKNLCYQPNKIAFLIKSHFYSENVLCRSQWPRGLRRRSTASRLPRSWVRIPTGAWMFVCCVYCVLSCRGLCDELITRTIGVLTNVARRRVWSWNLVWRGGHSPHWAAEPQEAIARAGLQSHRRP